MNPINHHWQRLLKAAAQAPRHPASELPFGFEARLLAGWKSSWAAPDDSLLLLMLLRRAFFCACLMMLLSVAVNYRSLLNSTPSELAIADSAIKMSLLP